MGNFNRGDRFSGQKNSRFGGRGGSRGFGNRRDRDNDRPERFSAVCDGCGHECTVPFRPSGDKPVYCDSCFGSQKDGGRKSDRQFSRNDRFDSSDKKMFDAICDQCHQPCQVPFRPSGDKPVYCDSCFTSGAKDHGPKKGKDETVKQLTVINAKLDKIMKHLNIVDVPIVKIEKSLELEDIGEDLSIIVPVKEKKAKKNSDKKEKTVKKKVAVKKTNKKKKA